MTLESPTVKLFVGERLVVTGLPDEYKKQFKKKLTLPNPLYYRLVRSNKRKAAFATPKEFIYYYENGEQLYLPRGMRKIMEDFLVKKGIQYTVKEDTVYKKSSLIAVKNIKLRDYQQKIVDDIIDKDYREGIINASTGSGKTIMMLELIHRMGITATILVPNTLILKQIQREADKFYGVKASLIGDGHKEIGKVTVSTFQSLFNNHKLLEELSNNTSMLMVDECFLKGTQVLTEEGYKPIEEINVGTQVETPTGRQKVIRTQKTIKKEIRKIKLDDNIISVTNNHPLLTPKGWVKAEELKIGSKILTNDFVYDILSLNLIDLIKKYGYRKGLFTMQKKIRSLEEFRSKKIMQQGVFTYMGLREQRDKSKTKENFKLTKIQRNGIKKSKRMAQGESTTRHRKQYKNEKKQSNGEEFCKKKSIRHSKKNKAQTKNKRWKWNWVYITTKKIMGSSWSWMENRIFSGYKRTKGKWLSNLLQVRHSESNKNDRSRSRRWFTLRIKEKEAGQKEDGIPYFKRVEDIQIQECGSSREFKNGFEVYNLEIENCPVYVVNDIVVHNCHGVVSDEREKVLKKFRPKYLFGFSATIDREDGKADAVKFLLGRVIAKHEATMMKPEVHLMYSNVKVMEDEYHNMVEEMTENESRNSLIAGMALGELIEGRKLLILTKRVAHAKTIYDFLPESEQKFLIASDDKGRHDTLALLKSGLTDFNCIVGTTALLSQGFDLPQLDTLLLACDMRSGILTRQSVGRVLRLFINKKQPKIIDIVDNKNGFFARQAKSRQTIYRSCGWVIKDQYSFD